MRGNTVMSRIDSTMRQKNGIEAYATKLLSRPLMVCSTKIRRFAF